MPVSVSPRGDQEGWEVEGVHLDLYCEVIVLRATAFSLLCDWFKQPLGFFVSAEVRVGAENIPAFPFLKSQLQNTVILRI